MQKATIIFPHQLFENHPAIKKGQKIILVEEELFFRQYKFHCQKLILHRATLKKYEDMLIKKGFETIYLDTVSFKKTEDIFYFLIDKNINEVDICDVTDFLLAKRVERFAKKHQVKINWHDSPMFYLKRGEVNDWLKANKNPKMQFFYQYMRKKLHLLMNDDNTPYGGKYSFDTENRKKVPKNLEIPKVANLHFREDETFILEAKSYIFDNFKDNYGETSEFNYTVSAEGAKKLLDDFLKNRFNFFGPYEDAIVKEESYLFHSVLSTYLNIGILTPKEVVDEAVKFAFKNNVPIASLEGFIRQIIGWREFMRVMYVGYGTRMRTLNFFKHEKKLPATFWSGKTGILPVDNVIEKVLKTSYCHHIERLMVIGNYMLLNEYSPDDCYLWFMELFIDAYDWVMVPNVYGMSQFADGGIFATKPYISGSSYILKMSNYEKGIWAEKWNNDFWKFVFKHRDFMVKNPRMRMLIKMKESKR